MKGRITDIQRCAMNDGPGLRTLIFFAGCGMRCIWCQNPEALERSARLMFDPSKCSGCGACTAVCAQNACVRREDGSIGVDREKCRQCFTCTEYCYNEARRPSVRGITEDELAREVLKDRVFYQNSGGGVTLSGGEALLQTEFCEGFLRRMKREGVHTAVETAGYYGAEVLERIGDAIDLFLFDLKCVDPAKHRKYTGVDNAGILANFRAAAKGGNVILRVALIPGVNDKEEFEKIIIFAAKEGVEEVHILPFHSMGDFKYSQLGTEYGLAGKETENSEEVERCARKARNLGLRVSIGGAGGE